ncbi:MAG: NAD(P)-binding protein, partial [Bacteroidota bacterium]
MTRQQFLQTLGFLGAGLAYPSLTAGSDEPLKSSFSGNVLIVGAGAAGLYAGYLLERYGIEYTILEASPVYGGRMKVNHSFADFPIPLGAEWVTSDHLQ